MTTAKVRFSPYAWAKYIYLRDKGPTEIGAFGISTADNPLALIDVIMVKQKSSGASVKFDDTAIGDFFDDQIDLGLQPYQFGRVWLHTHPGQSALPSQTDEATFRDVFNKCDFAVMVILAKQDQVSAILKYNTGINAEFKISVEIDYSLPFPASNLEAWDKEYNDTLEPNYVFTNQHTQYYPYEKSILQSTEDLKNKSFFTPAKKDNESQDSYPSVEWIPLSDELVTMTLKDQYKTLKQLELKYTDIEDYVCCYEGDLLVCKEDPELSDYQDTHYDQDFTDESGNLKPYIKTGFLSD